MPGGVVALVYASFCGSVAHLVRARNSQSLGRWFKPNKGQHSTISSTGESTELLPLWFGVQILDGGPADRFNHN